MQKADIAISRTATARGKAELADVSADHAKIDSEVAIQTAREFAPDFKPSLLERFERIRVRERFRTTMNDELPGNKLKLNDNQISLSKTTVANNIMSPNKQINSSHQPQQQQQQTHVVQQQSVLNTQATNRRTSVNQMMRQPSLDNATSNPVDYGNTLGLNQHFGQPQPPGNTAFITPQKFAQQISNSLHQHQQQNYIQPSVSVQQSQHNLLYQNSRNNSNANQYQQMNPLQQQQENQNNYPSHQQNYSNEQQVSNYLSNDMRRNSRQVSDSGRPMLGSIRQTSIDHFDHYKRPPSRDSSVDRYSRAASRLGAGSRQPSVDRQGINSQGTVMNPDTLLEPNRAGSQLRGTTPAPNLNGSVLTGVMSGSGAESRRGSRSGTPVFQQQLHQQPSIQTIQAQYSNPNQPFEDVLLRQRTLGQDIIPSPGQPKRTESLFVPNKPVVTAGGGGGGGSKGKVCNSHHFITLHSNISKSENLFSV